MVINDRYKFVFVHVPKSGGSSVTAALVQLDGNNSRWLDRHTKHETLPAFQRNWRSRRRMSDHILGRSPMQYRAFGFVRHPWERLSSLYRYMKEKRPRDEIDRVNSLNDFIQLAVNGEAWIHSLHSMRPQIDYFRGVDEVRIAVDYLGHYEHLAEDFDSVAQRLGLPTCKLLTVNRSSNAAVDHRKLFTDSMVDAVARMFRRDIEAFGYEFDRRQPSNRCSGPIGHSLVV